MLHELGLEVLSVIGKGLFCVRVESHLHLSLQHVVGGQQYAGNKKQDCLVEGRVVETVAQDHCEQDFVLVCFFVGVEHELWQLVPH